MRDDFAIFIISYNRADSISTLKTLQKANYTGKYYIVVGDDDPQLNEYKNIYKEKLKIFNKEKLLPYIDTYDCGGNNKCALYVRNYCFILAKELNLKYFLEFDDDYDEIIDICIDFLEDTKATSIAFAQHGDFIGGVNNGFLKNRLKRKAMNSWFCKTDKPFKFRGRMNDDVNTYIGLGKIGNVFLTFCDVSLKQKHTQQNKGGMTDTYNEDGTYLKSFYTVLANPSCVVVAPMGDKHIRFHHRINWNNAVPKIISDKYKK